MLRVLRNFIKRLPIGQAKKQRKMEIFRDNFEEKLPEILSAIKDADFIAYDFEFTGLFTEKGHGIVDTYAERYERYRKQCVNFLPIQAGLCTFKYNHDERKFIYLPFSIYLFPHSSESFCKATPKVYMLQADSIDFLVKHKFDFNKAFHRGIGFGTIEEFNRRKEEIEKRYSQWMEELEKVEPPSFPLPDDKKSFITEKAKKVQEFLKDTTPDEDKELVFSNLNGFERKLIYTFLAAEVSSDPYAFTIESRYTAEDGPTMVIRCNKEGLEGKRKALLKRKEEQIKNVELQMGFSKIIETISGSEATLIGHNQGIDLIQTLHHCVSPLPQSYCEFKEFATSIFPRLIDTKYIALSKFCESISNTGLSNLFETVQNHPFKMPNLEPRITEYNVLLDSSTYHDASFDAFITGSSFLSMLTSLAEEQEVDNPVENAPKLLKRFYHRIPLMNCIGITHMYLAGSDDPMVRNNAFIATFPAAWKTSDLRDVFKPVISDFTRLSIHWQNDTSAWICLSDEVNSSAVEQLSDPSIGFSVISFENHFKVQSDSAEPSAKRMKVANGAKSETKASESALGAAAAVFDVPKVW